MQAGAVGQPGVHPWCGVIQPAARRGRQPDREPADRGVVGEPDRTALQAGTPVHPHRVRPVDQDVTHPGHPQEGFQGAGAGELVDGVPHGEQDVVVTQQPAGLLADQSGHTRLRRHSGLQREPGTDPIEQRRAVHG